MGKTFVSRYDDGVGSNSNRPGNLEVLGGAVGFGVQKSLDRRDPESPEGCSLKSE